MSKRKQSRAFAELLQLSHASLSGYRTSNPRSTASTVPIRPHNSTPLKAEGRTLSSKNADKLKALADQLEVGGEIILSILSEAGIDTQAKAAPLQAGNITDEYVEWVNEVNWWNRLQTILYIFSTTFEYCCSEAPKEIPELIKALTEMLLELAADAQEEGAEMEASALLASAGNPTIVQMPLRLELQAGVDANNCPMSGVLFRVDEPSENVPAVGAGYPIYVPREVALEAIHQVSGLPIDAANNLENHASDEIVGVMGSATIEGNDFRIRGRLWGWSNPDKVELIRAEARQGNLGMSMTGFTWGNVVNLAGQQVYKVSKLKLMGGCILYKDRATYEQTDVIAASRDQSTPEAAIPIAASDKSSTQENTAMTPEQEAKLDKLVAGMSSIVARVDVLEAAHQQEQQAAAKEKEEQTQKAATEAIVEAAVQRVMQQYAPGRQPQQLTRSLGNTAPQSEPVNDAALELARLQGQYQALSNRYDTSARTEKLKLLDRINGLQAQLQPA